MTSEVESWWEQAKEDFDTGIYLFEGKKYKQCSFYCQQAAEKAMKALLIQNTKKLIKIHDLVKLGDLIGLDKDLIKECEKLSAVYIDTRYPDNRRVRYTKEEAKTDISIAENILKWVGKHI